MPRPGDGSFPGRGAASCLGGVAEADFAADLAQVIVGKGNAEYLDPARFFANTYPTRGLRNLLTNVCRRLTGAGGEAAAIFRLDTSYGGGKTHGLIALTHAARGMNGVSSVEEFVDPSLLPKGYARIAAFDGENADPANGRTMGDGVLAHTPWGEIAYALAGKDGYARVRNSDKSRIAPGAETLRELFGGEPTLILLDELSVYLRKVRNLDDARDQLTAFLTSLFKAVEGAPNAALVYTLAIGKDGRATDAYNAENQFIADNMAEMESVSARRPDSTTCASMTSATLLPQGPWRSARACRSSAGSSVTAESKQLRGMRTSHVTQSTNPPNGSPSASPQMSCRRFNSSGMGTRHTRNSQLSVVNHDLRHSCASSMAAPTSTNLLSSHHIKIFRNSLKLPDRAARKCVRILQSI